MSTPASAQALGESHTPPLGYLRWIGRWSWRWRWALIPLLAVVAYGAALGIGFLSDDFLHLYGGERKGFDFESLVPGPQGRYYRPIGTLITWELGWQLYGSNPFPYHLVSLIAHALTALALGLWLAAVTSQRSLGWLAGAIFATFPLHLEAVGWIAAQWDALAALFTILSLWIFTMWWKHGSKRPLYILSLLLYALGVFTKESVLAFLPIFALSAWLSTRKDGGSWRAARRLAYALLPYGAVLALNLGIRLSAGGYMAGLAGSGINYREVFWDRLLSDARLLLSPINAAVLGSATAQVVGMLSSVALLVGLLVYGHSQRYVLLMAGAWLIMALIPVLSFIPRADDLQDNRLLYMASAGYCTGVAALMHAAIASAGKWRLQALGLPGIVLLLSIGACWVHLSPWQVATAQVKAVGQELTRLIPPLGHGPYNSTWYVENVPDSYKGAYVLRLGLGGLRYFTARELPAIEAVGDAAVALVTGGEHDTFALWFDYDQGEARYHVNYLNGITEAAEPPTPQQMGDSPLLWDFRGCAAGVTGDWEIVQAVSRCEPGKGLVLQPGSDDPQLLGPSVALDTASSQARFLRLRVSARYPSGPPQGSQPIRQTGHWYWKSPGGDYGEEHSNEVEIKQDGDSHVYWTFLSVPFEAGGTIGGLRFDPINGALPAEVNWIAVDLVK